MLDVVLLGLEKFGGVVVDGDGGDLVASTIEFTALLASIELAGDVHDHIKSVCYLTKYGVTVVEEGGRHMTDEKLRAIGTWAGICHGEDAGRIVAKIGVKLVGKLVAGTTSTGLGGITTLKHEAVDYAMKGNVVVVSALSQVEKVGTGEGSFFCMHGGGDVAGSGMKSDLDVGHDA